MSHLVENILEKIFQKTFSKENIQDIEIYFKKLEIKNF